MLGKLQEIKAKYHFGLIDKDNNGYIEIGDVMREMAMIAELTGLEEGSSKYETLKANQLGWWEHIVQVGDKNQDERISFEEWIQFEEELFTAIALAAGQTPNEPLEALKESGRFWFEIADADGNGEISQAEHKNILVAWGGKEEEAASCFQKLDLNGDGVISKDEFVKAMNEFFLSNDPEAPGNYLFGNPFLILTDSVV